MLTQSQSLNQPGASQDKFAIGSSSNTLAAGLMLTSCLGFIGITAWELIKRGPFAWHVSIPETRQGGLEVLALLAALCGSQLIANTKLRLVSLLLFSELYLRRHAVDFALIVDGIYLEILIALGFCVMKLTRSGSQTSDTDYLKCFILGVGTWSVVAWLASAAGLGSVHDLRILTVVLGLFAAFSHPKPISMWIIGRAAYMRLRDRVALSLAAGWILVLFARTNVALGYDSLWYGFRGEHVLVGTGTAFDATGLVSNVFYYPKLYELLLIPVSGLGNTGVISGVTIMCLVMLSLSCNALLARMGMINRLFRIAATLTCISVPVVSNMALDPKPDIPEALFLMLAWLFAIDFVQSRRTPHALWMLACLILATQSKLVAIPYAGGLVLAALVGLYLQRRDDRMRSDTTPVSMCLASVAVVLAIATTLLISLRTIATAGLPTITPDPLVKLWNALGFQLKPPAGYLSITSAPNWSDAPDLLRDILFRPHVLSHMVITWIGNSWFWLLLVAVFMVKFKPSAKVFSNEAGAIPFAGLHAALIGVGLYLMFGVGYGTRGSDGNYYLAAIIPAMLIGLAHVVRKASTTRVLRVTLLICLGCFSAFQAGYAFISADWAPGTRAFDTNFGGGIHEYRKRTMSFFDWLGAGNIYHELASLRSSPSVVGCISDEVSMRIPGRGQSVKLIRDMRPEYVDTGPHFLKFLRDNKVDYLIMPNQNENNVDQGICASMPWIAAAADEYASDPSILKVSDEKYTMYRIRREQ